MDIWHVQSSNRSQLLLWLNGKQNFLVSEKGEYTPLIESTSYTLINSKYASIFQNLTGQVEINPVEIHDKILNTKNTEYVELVIKNSISPDVIGSIMESELKIWTYNGILFVSDSIKKELEYIGNDELEFYLGFSRFAL